MKTKQEMIDAIQKEINLIDSELSKAKGKEMLRLLSVKRKFLSLVIDFDLTYPAPHEQILS